MVPGIREKVDYIETSTLTFERYTGLVAPRSETVRGVDCTTIQTKWWSLSTGLSESSCQMAELNYGAIPQMTLGTSGKNRRNESWLRQHKRCKGNNTMADKEKLHSLCWVRSRSILSGADRATPHGMFGGRGRRFRGCTAHQVTITALLLATPSHAGTVRHDRRRETH